MKYHARSDDKTVMARGRRHARVGSRLNCLWMTTVLALGLSPASQAETLECFRLTGDQLLLCDAMARCAAAADTDVRTTCTGNALRSGGARALDQALRARAADAESGTAAADRVVAVPAVRAPTPPPVSKAAPVAAAKKPEVAPVTKTPAQPTGPGRSLADDGESKGKSTRSLPRRFEASVIKVRKLIRDRQLVVLDNELLFEGEGPVFDVGEAVEVIKRGRIGRSYTVSGNSGRQRVMKPIECDRDSRDKSQVTMRKCAMLDADPGDQ